MVRDGNEREPTIINLISVSDTKSLVHCLAPRLHRDSAIAVSA